MADSLLVLVVVSWGNWAVLTRRKPIVHSHLNIAVIHHMNVVIAVDESVKRSNGSKDKSDVDLVDMWK